MGKAGDEGRLYVLHHADTPTWKARADRDRLEYLVAERQRLDAIAWVFEMLPIEIVGERERE